MPEEFAYAVGEAVETEEVNDSSAPVKTPVEKYDVESFVVDGYSQYFPSEHASQLHQLLTTRSYGWKQAARLLHRIKESDEVTRELKGSLEDMCDGKPRTRDAMKDARSGLRRVLSNLTEEKLKELCTSKDVSYSSFMNSNDRQGLIEAVIDELLVSV